MFKSNLTHQEYAIIRNICDIQIQSLLRTATGTKIQDCFTTMGIMVTQSDINQNVSELIREFDQLRMRPSRILTLEPISLSQVKHILLNYDEEFSVPDYIQGKYGLWRKMNVKDMFNPLPS